MTCEQLQEALSDRWAGTLSPAERAGVDAHLAQCAACRDEAGVLESLWQQLAEIADEAPSPDLQARFDRLLDTWRDGAAAARDGAHRPRPAPARVAAWSPVFLAAAAVLLMATGFAAGRLVPDTAAATQMADLRGEVRSMRQVVALSLLQQPSASERLRGVTWSHQIEQPGEEVLDALLDTLRRDTNVNVRLAAIDALRQFGRTEYVRDGLLQAVVGQGSPLVQIELIDLMVELREQRSRDVLRTLAGDERVDRAVRERARWAMERLET